MSNLDAQVRTFRPNAIPRVDYELRDRSDGAGPFIDKWNEAKLGPRPNIADLPDGQARAEQDRLDREARALSSVEAELVAAVEAIAQHVGMGSPLLPDLSQRAQRRRALGPPDR